MTAYFDYSPWTTATIATSSTRTDNYTTTMSSWEPMNATYVCGEYVGCINPRLGEKFKLIYDGEPYIYCADSGTFEPEANFQTPTAINTSKEQLEEIL